NGNALFLKLKGCGLDRAKGAAPADDEDFAALGAGPEDVGSGRLDAGDLGGAKLHHVLVIARIVTHLSGDILFLQPANTMLKPRCSRQCPGPAKFPVALV